jgi:3-oxoacyl-[acyl-carrier protein] reductase
MILFNVGHEFAFQGKSVLVVGGSSGIGNGVAQSFRARGADVHVWGTRRSASEYESSEGSDLAGLTYRQTDVSNPDAIATAAKEFTKLDVLVLSQGTVQYRKQEFEIAGFARTIEVNLNSVMACALAFKDLLTQSKGSLIPISSTAAFRATVGTPGYSASKGAITALVRSLGSAWASDGVRVNAVAPGLVDTKLVKVTTANPERLARTLAKIPVSRLGRPDDIAGAVLFLASSMSTYICGQTIIVDGGLLL